MFLFLNNVPMFSVSHFCLPNGENSCGWETSVLDLNHHC
jgi:hypothetical protein